MSHYNESLGGIGGIWAEDWHSLDGTSWLYFVTSGKSPFDLAEGIPGNVNPLPAAINNRNFAVSVYQSGELLVVPVNPLLNDIEIQVIQMDGRTILERKVPAHSGEIKLWLSTRPSVGKIVFVRIINHNKIESYPVMLY